MATTSAMLGSIGAWLAAGGVVHSGSIGVVFSVVGGGLGGGEISTSGSMAHPAPRVRDKIRIRETAKSLIFILFIATLYFSTSAKRAKIRD
jgi:hypothetical protein